MIVALPGLFSYLFLLSAFKIAKAATFFFVDKEDSDECAEMLPDLSFRWACMSESTLWLLYIFRE